MVAVQHKHGMACKVRGARPHPSLVETLRTSYGSPVRRFLEAVNVDTITAWFNSLKFVSSSKAPLGA